MPGNELGDRVHNFFGQENLSQVQYLQITDGNWRALNNNLLPENQRQISAPLVSKLKNFSVQQSGCEHGRTSQSSHLSQGLNLTQTTQLNQRPESGRTQSQNQQPALNGYLQGVQVFEPRQNEANFSSVHLESDRHNLMSRGPSLSELKGNGQELYKKNWTRSDASISPVNFNFFGPQQHIGSWNPNLLQGLPRPHTGINDRQLLQQHLMLTQMQELQRQQQLPHLEARQHNSINQASSFAKVAVGNHPSSLNGIPVNETSNFMWQQEVMPTNANWLQPSTIVQGSPGGLVLFPEQGQAIRKMGLVPQQADLSLYGLPVSNFRGPSNQNAHIQVEKTAVPEISGQSQYPQVQVDKSSSPQVSGSTNLFAVHHHAAFADQANKQESSLSGEDIQGKNIFRLSVEQGCNSGPGMENYQFRSGYVQGFNGKQELSGLPEPSQEKSVMELAASHGASTLDPTEKKILFGSDDNLWEAFSGNSGFSMLDNTDCLNGLPSMQSGSWSALMQSAVAETSSNGPGAQEEWSGFTFQNVEPLYSVGIDSGKQQPHPTVKNLHVSSNSNCTPAIHLKEPQKLNSSTNHVLHGFQQSGFSSHDPLGKFQTDTHRSIPPFPARDKWLRNSPERKLLAEGNDIYGTSIMDNQEKNILSSRNHQQTPVSCNSSGQPINLLNTWNLMESVLPDSNVNLKSPENENLSQPHPMIDRETPRHEVGHVFGMWRHGPTIRPSTGNTQVFEGDSSEKAQNLESRRVNSEGFQPLPNRHRVDLWRDVNPSRSSRGNEGPAKYQHHMEKSPQVLESSENSNLDKVVSERHEIDISNRKDGFTEDSLPNTSLHAGCGLREPSRLNAGDSCSFFGSEPKSSLQFNQRSIESCKFQYHPMGEPEVDVEHSHGKTHVIDSQPLPQQLGDQGYLGQLNFGSNKKNHVESEKVEAERLDEVASKSTFAGHLLKRSSPLDRSFDVRSLEQEGSVRLCQNMLELLPKVDQVKERGIATHISSQGIPYSKISEPETSDGSVMHTQQNQGFGLQLGPPAQRSPIQEQCNSCHSSPQTVVNSPTMNSETGDNGHSWVNPIQQMISRDSSQGILRTNGSGQTTEKGLQYNVPGNFPRASHSSFSFSRVHAQNQNAVTSQTFDASFTDRIPPNELDRSDEAIQFNQPAVAFVPGHTLERNSARSVELSQPGITNHINSGDLRQQIRESDSVPALQSYNSPNLSQQGASPKVYNVWTTVSTKKFPSDFSLYPVKNVETVPGAEKLGSQDIEKEGNAPSGYDACASPSQSSVSKEHSEKEFSDQQAVAENTDVAEKTMSTSQGKEPLVMCATDASHFTSATQHDIEAFGRTLLPNNVLHQNHPQMHQAQMLRGTETDPSKRSIKRFKGLDGGLESQQLPSAGAQYSPYGYNVMVNGYSLTSADTKLSSFSSSPGDNQDGNVSSQDKSGFDQKNATLYCGNHITSSRGEHSLISPRMAPSWFNQFGSFKNGKMLSVYDVQKIASLKPVEECIVGKQSDNLHVCDSIETVKPPSDAANQPVACQQTPTLMSISSESVPSVLLSPDSTDGNMVAIRPQKRKSFPSELVPWHKVLAGTPERPQNISMAELDWARAANRLIEKVEDGAETIGELAPLVKPKRRIILTTQLMQQLLCPLSASFLSTDVKLHYESLVYSLARVTLGDACRTISCSGNGILVSSSNRNLWSEQKSSTKIGDEYLKVVEDLMSRAKKVEDDGLRADSRASFLDFRVECQDLERFSVINRFAKFHGRGQADGAETSSSETPGYVQKPFPHKYVNAVPTPKNLPDRGRSDIYIYEQTFLDTCGFISNISTHYHSDSALQNAVS